MLCDESEKHFTLAELTAFVGADVQGDGDIVIHRLATLEEAGKGSLSFLSNPIYTKLLLTTKASALILSPEIAQTYEGNALVIHNPYLAYARISRLFEWTLATCDVHPTAWIHESAVVSPDVRIGPHVTIEAGAVIAAGATIAAGSVIGHHSVIGKDTIIHSNVTIYHGVLVGDRCILHSGAVLGSDGFGFAHDESQGWVKIAQLAGVVVGDDVDIGANVSIDRGALVDTVIGNGVIIDNQVHIAHNVVIGEKTAIAGCSAISGSTRIGRHCTIGGGSCIAGHLNIVDGVHLGGMAAVTNSITEPGHYSSGTVGCMPVKMWRKSTVRFRQLDDIARRLKKLEKTLD
ncbi:MAG: UDP-3-O-(3-hydroxymyristoyl)glucosamine N-acyltransferase [Endozoicomonadaceae bacterium]|nr:UDP-3-O-(3-hydroxymyristoyl)glucosamine N-acyltransferase [Endozoicomonadaceae bacterium]